MKKKYVKTLNLYNDMVISIDGPSGDFDQIALDTTPADWSASVQDTVKKIEDNEKQQGH